MSMAIRDATERDIPAIARVFVATWRETYRGIVPDGVLKSPALAERGLACGMSIRAGDHAVFVADAGGDVVGFVVAGPARDALLNVDAEIKAVYVLKRFQYRGIGTRLMAAAAAALPCRGPASLGLWVSRQDVAALAFFRALGGTVGMARIAEMPGRSFIEMAMLWDAATDLTRLDPCTEHLPRRTRAAGDGRSPMAAGTTGARDVAPAA